MPIQFQRAIFRATIIAACIFAMATVSHAGFLYVFNERAAAANQIYGFSVNEATGALTALAGFPVSSGGNGVNTSFSEMMAIDRANLRLYALNLGSNTIGAFSINPNTGALTALPYSPFTMPVAVAWRTIRVHPSGSPVIVGDGINSRVVSISVTATTAVSITGNPFSTGTAQPYSSVFSPDGHFFYTGGNTGNTFAGFGVNPRTGGLVALPGSPFDSGATLPQSYATDLQGRLFMGNSSIGELRVFTTGFGVPAAVAGNPFFSALSNIEAGALHPNERFYYLAETTNNRVAALQIAGSGSATTLAPVAGSPVGSGGTETNTISLNNPGTFLFAGNATSRNITTYAVTPSTGVLTFGNVQPADTLGTSGRLRGMAYMPTVFTVTNTDDSGAGSLRQAVSSANTSGGGMVVFDPVFFSVPRTILLTTGQISLVANVTITGPGPHLLTIQVAGPTNAINRAFNVAAVASLTGMTLTGGNVLNPGGAIFNSNILRVADCVITGNTAALTGGGIRHLPGGLLSISNTTISGNTSTSDVDGGGGIDSTGPLIITNSTISGNTKINGNANGGGIWTSSNTTITNSTITNNSAVGTSAAGGIFRASGTVSVRNTIIAGNQNNTIRPDVVGTFAASGGGFNIIGNVGTATGFNQTGDQSGTGASPLDPGLVKVLAFRGGTTPTHALLLSSPAVDKGNNSNFVTDQRVFARPFDNPSIPNTSNAADVGAFERRALESIHTAPFDFDGDGKTDISIFRPSVGEWWINRSSNGTTLAAQFGATSDKIAPGDFTGDGKSDIAVWRPSTGEWFVLRSENFSFFAFAFGANGDVPVPADYDADGKADPAVFRPLGATWFVLRSSDGVAAIQSFGSNGDIPVPADYDGDGKSDIAIFRPSNGEWWLNRSTTGGIATTFGNSADKPVQGDYTGDGKADIAFWRPSTGEWFVLRSDDFSFFSFPFGTAGDAPAPGDYDGDGRHDATVFRPSNSTWFLLRTTAGTLIQQFGVGSDRPVPNAYVP